MIKEITKYPQTPSLEFAVNVRFFNEELHALIEDLKDTMQEHSLTALASFQIGSPLSVIVIKEGDDFLELINPKVLTRSGTVEPQETTAYFPGLSAKTKRYEKIKLMYEDREGKQQFLDAEGDLSVTIQRKIDYTFGSNFRVRLDEEERVLFDSKLEFGTDAITQNECPTVFKRDIILKVFKVLLLLGVLALVVSLFVSAEILATLATIQNYVLVSMLVLIVTYFFYAQYEGKQYKHCSSCQIGNIIGTSIILIIKLSALALGTYIIF